MCNLRKLKKFQSSEGFYKRFLAAQRDTVVSLLNKLNNINRLATFGRLLSDLCEK
jgi:hypothetical protein